MNMDKLRQIHKERETKEEPRYRFQGRKLAYFNARTYERKQL